MKGFVISISALLLLSALLVFSQFYLNLNLERESEVVSVFSVEKAGFVRSDLSVDLNKLLETSVDVNRGVSFTEIFLRDKLPSDLNKLNVLGLRSFLSSVYAKQQNISIEVDFNKLVDGKTELVFSNALQYDYSYANDTNVFFYVPASDSNVTVFDINVTVNDSVVSSIPWSLNPSGDINVSLRYEDGNGVITSSGKLGSSTLNTFTFNYSGNPNDSFSVEIGAIEGSQKALRISESFDNAATRSSISVRAVVPSSSDNLYWFYDADLNFSVADVNSSGKILIGENF